MTLANAIYIHIPFCNYICDYCDFCKVFYDKKFVRPYLDRLEEEIKERYHNELITSIYIGGGTPSSLAIDELERLFSIISIFKKAKDIEFTFEANPDSLSLEKIKLLKKYGVNRVSLGVETINLALAKTLGRETKKEEVTLVVNNLKKEGITNINVDLIYAIYNESLEDLNKDLDFLLSLDVCHISTYSLIIENNTKLKLKGIKNIDTNLDREMYELICKRLKENNYFHYEVSNFAKRNYESKHNLVYWHNLKYYGFGVSSSSYLANKRVSNTKSITNYINNKNNYKEEIITLKDEMFYEIMLAFRLKEGLEKEKFFKKYHVRVDKLFNYQELVLKKILDDNDLYLAVNSNYIYVLDEVTLEFFNTLQTNVYNDIIS